MKGIPTAKLRTFRTHKSPSHRTALSFFPTRFRRYVMCQRKLLWLSEDCVFRSFYTCNRITWASVPSFTCLYATSLNTKAPGITLRRKAQEVHPAWRLLGLSFRLKIGGPLGDSSRSWALQIYGSLFRSCGSCDFGTKISNERLTYLKASIGNPYSEPPPGRFFIPR